MTATLMATILIFGAGIYTAFMALRAAIRTYVVPRAEGDPVTMVVFVVMRRLFGWAAGRSRSYEDADRVMAFYAPVTLAVLPGVYLTLVAAGFTLMYWALNGIDTPLYRAFQQSGSSLLTLGYAPAITPAETVLSFSEATIGLVLTALVIAYIPVIYNAFSSREKAVNMLEVRAGNPPSAVEMLVRFARLGRPQGVMAAMWNEWESWFAELSETHTSLIALVFFRSPRSHQHWLNAAAAVLDAAAFRTAVIDAPRQIEADLCIRAGYLALRAIADYFGIPYNPSPRPDDPISVTREDWESAVARMEEAGVPIKADREQAWRDWAGWRVNYDAVLIKLAKITMAPPAMWNGVISGASGQRTEVS